MENVYDTRYREKLYYILPKRTRIEKKNNLSCTDTKKIAVFVNLYYFQDLEWYWDYLKKIPENISLFIFSSDEMLLECVKTRFKNRDNFRIIKKENRGRDVSALLVEGKKYCAGFDYLCFIHDKRWRTEKEKQETQIWIKSLWDNMLASPEYISNIIGTFEAHSDIGLLCPPEPIGIEMRAWYNSAWSDSFEETKRIAEKLRIDADISQTKPPISLSTVFWCKTDAMKKLLEYPWKYEDFHDEPMPVSGTISHGIERVLAFVAQDAGYKTGMVMVDEYAEYLLSFLQYNLQEVFSILDDNYGMTSIGKVMLMKMNKEPVIDFFKQHENVFLYGSGVVGRRVLKQMRVWGCEPKGFVISDKPVVKECEDLPVFSLEEIMGKQNLGIIVTVGVNYKEDIKKNLTVKGIKEVLFLDA